MRYQMTACILATKGYYMQIANALREENKTVASEHIFLRTDKKNK